MKLGFILDGMTYLKYYIPLVEEAKTRGVQSTFFISRSNKYNCPFTGNHLQVLKNICDTYDIVLDYHNEKAINNCNVVFTIEGTKIQSIDKSKIFSLCCSTDFTMSYDSYIDKVAYVVVSSNFLANYYKKANDKNLYLGTPKFDVKLKEESIRDKYDLRDKKIITLFYPRLRDIHQAPIRRIVEDLKKINYEVVIKTRGKDPISKTNLSRFNFEDISWHPHTSLELIKISDIIVNFSSSVIEETTALQVPLINFHIKPFVKPFNFLYDSSFVKNLNVDYTFEEMKSSIENLTTTNFLNDFAVANKKLFDTKTSSKDIIDFIT